jgi:ssDNA-binding Zn-finger/Zn-ribbon topoisomerase 1
MQAETTSADSKIPPPGPADCNAIGVKCPKCGAAMREKNRRGNFFWGCSEFPNCRGTREMSFSDNSKGENCEQSK